MSKLASNSIQSLPAFAWVCFKIYLLLISNAEYIQSILVRGNCVETGFCWMPAVKVIVYLEIGAVEVIIISKNLVAVNEPLCRNSFYNVFSSYLWNELWQVSLHLLFSNTPLNLIFDLFEEENFGFTWRIFFFSHRCSSVFVINCCQFSSFCSSLLCFSHIQ